MAGAQGVPRCFVPAHMIRMAYDVYASPYLYCTRHVVSERHLDASKLGIAIVRPFPKRHS